MKTLFVSRFYAIFMGFCFLGGQFFFSRFDLGATIAGICGMLAGVVGEDITSPTVSKKRKTLGFCIGGVAGLTIYSFTSFAFDKMTISEFPWVMVLSFCLALYVIASKILRQQQ